MDDYKVLNQELARENEQLRKLIVAMKAEHKRLERLLLYETEKKQVIQSTIKGLVKGIQEKLQEELSSMEARRPFQPLTQYEISRRARSRKITTDASTSTSTSSNSSRSFKPLKRSRPTLSKYRPLALLPAESTTKSTFTIFEDNEDKKVGPKPNRTSKNQTSVKVPLGRSTPSKKLPTDSEW